MLDVSRSIADLEELKSGYLQHLVLKNYAPLGIRQIDQNLRFFVAWLKGRGINDAASVDVDAFENYKAHLSTEYLTRKGTPLVVGTVISRLFNVQNWFDWMRKKGAIFTNTTAAVKLPKHDKRLPGGVLRQDEIRKLMDQPDLKTPLGYRDRTMMEVLYATGLRAAELVALRIPDVDLKKKLIRVRNGKGGNERMAPLSSPCCRFLERYLAEFRPVIAEGMRPAGHNWIKKAGTAEDFVFASAYGGAFCPRWLNQLMRQYLRKAGIARPISPVHGFRHAVATHLVADGMDVRYVQILLGHQNINSTQIYTHVERATLHRLLKRHHPRALAKETVQAFIEEEKLHAVAA